VLESQSWSNPANVSGAASVAGERDERVTADH
jgi:hypothetical protein